MSDTLDSLGRKISGATDLKSVVRTMKVLAASNIAQYEKAVSALGDYYHTVEMGLFICLQNTQEVRGIEKMWQEEYETIYIIAFGSDQGLVGQFNDVLSDLVVHTLAGIKGDKKIRVVGERMQARVEDKELPVSGLFSVPNSVATITPLVGQILSEYESHVKNGIIPRLYLFYNKQKHASIYEPVFQSLLPLDSSWRNGMATFKWPTQQIPEAMFGVEPTLRALIRNYLFVSLFRACAESLASENASRLAAMQRAEKNIDELLADTNRAYHRLRQSSIDEELFDVISGSGALNTD